MRTWATSGRVKIDRAYENIRDLETRIASFKRERPYPVIPDDDPDRKPYARALEDFYSPSVVTPALIRTAARIPPMWSAIAADAVHNLNVALDHLWQRTIHGPKSRRKDHFPACRDADSADSRFRGKEHGACKTAVRDPPGWPRFQDGQSRSGTLGVSTTPTNMTRWFSSPEFPSP